MTNKIELLSQDENFTIGNNSNLTRILANVVSIGNDTSSNVTLSIPQNISSSYNLILPARQGASGESLVYDSNGELKWHDPTVLKQVVSVYGSTLTGNLITAIGTHDSPTYLDAYTANITPMSENSKIFVQFKVNYKAALSASNQISFYIKKTYDDNVSIYTESLFGPYNAAGGLTGQYISNLIDEPLTTSSISYQLGYKINGNVQISDTLGILGYDTSYNNTIFLQEFEGSGSNATSVWNKGSDSNGLYYNDGTVHIGSSKNSLGSQNTPGVALDLSGNLVGTSATFSGNVNAVTITATTTTTNNLSLDGTLTTNNLSLDGTLTTSNSSRVVGDLIPSVDNTYNLGSPTHMWRDVYIGPGSLYINNKKVIEDNSDTINITTSAGQNLRMKTSNNGQLQIQSEQGGIAMSKSGNTGDITITTISGGDIHMNSNDNIQIKAGENIQITAKDDLQLSSKSGTIQLKSTVNISNGMTVSNPTGEDIKIDDNLQITGQVKTNEIIEYTTNNGVTIENVLIKDGNINGNITGTVSSLANHTTTDLSEGSNLYYTTARVRNDLSGGTGINYDQSTGVFSIDQLLPTDKTTDNVQFNNVTVDGILNSDDITGTNITVSNNLVVSGNLTVNGSQTIVNSTTLDIGDNKIIVNADGGTITDAGIIANVSGVEHEFVYNTNNNAWGTSENLNIDGNLTVGNNVTINGELLIDTVTINNGNITATTFIGDGSGLTGILTNYSDASFNNVDISGTLTGIINDINLHNTKPSSINSTKIINILSNNFNEFKPWYLDNTYSYNNGPVHEHYGGFIGGVLAPNGKIILVPFHSPVIGIYDPITNIYNDGPGHGQGEEGAFIGGVLAPNGKIILVPNTSPNVGIYDPITNSYDNGAEHEKEGSAFLGGVLAPNGKIIFVPNNSEYVGIYDPITDSYNDGAEHVQEDVPFFGGVLAPNGKIIFVPYNSPFIGIYDPITDSYNHGAEHGQEDVQFVGGVLAPNGKIIFVPSQSPFIGIYDPITDSYNDGPAHGFTGNPIFSGGILAPNGKIIIVPRASLYIGIFENRSYKFTLKNVSDVYTPYFNKF